MEREKNPSGFGNSDIAGRHGELDDCFQRGRRKQRRGSQIGVIVRAPVDSLKRHAAYEKDNGKKIMDPFKPEFAHGLL